MKPRTLSNESVARALATTGTSFHINRYTT